MTDSKASCPYAVSVSDDEDNGDSQSMQMGDLVQVAMTSCPAFQSGACPFKDSTSADQVRHALLDVPPSHLQEQGHFYRALRHLHNVSQTLEDKEKFAIPGGCPVQSYARGEDVSFAEAMEEYSLASIMARMAQDLEETEDKSEGSHEEEDSRPLKQSQTSQVPSVSHSTTSKLEEESGDQVCLSEALKKGTAVSHQAAEDVHFVKNFIKGAIDRTLYGELVLALYHVYVKLEEALNQHAPQYFSSCHFPHELSRKEALEEDVDFWHASLPTRISPATQDFVDRLEYLSKTDPLLLLAHAYTRYLGDLSGGKILARVARKAMQLDKDGLDFYHFENITSAKVFKDQYRRALDELNLTPSQVSKLVAEANVAFVLNMRLFEELDVMANIEGAQVRDLREALAFANPAESSSADSHDAMSENDSKKECPFAKMGKASAFTNQATSASVATLEASEGDAKKECPFAKMSRAFKSHKQTISSMQVSWPLVAGLLLSVLWWGLQTSNRVDKVSVASVETHTPASLTEALLKPLQEPLDLDGPWM